MTRTPARRLGLPARCGGRYPWGHLGEAAGPTGGTHRTSRKNIFENNGQTLIICMYGIHKACPKVFPFGEKRVAQYNNTRCEKLGSGNRVLETLISQIRKFPPSGVMRDAPYRALVQRLAEQCGPRRPDPRPGDGRALPALGLARPAGHDIAKHRVTGPARPGPGISYLCNEKTKHQPLEKVGFPLHR